MIKHAPILDIEKVISRYEKKDNVPIKYVCTTDLRASDRPVDVFYRESPHPEFGNRYFGVYAYNGDVMICNADIVESFEFGMIKDKDGNYWYSSSHHDCLFIDGCMIDGGREYIRSDGLAGVFEIVNGELIERKENIMEVIVQQSEAYKLKVVKKALEIPAGLFEITFTGLNVTEKYEEVITKDRFFMNQSELNNLISCLQNEEISV